MKQFVISSLTLLILDILWIILFMKSKYLIQVEKIQHSPMKVNTVAMVLAYALMILGLCVFVVPYMSKQKSMINNVIHAGLFGLVVYGIFDFTNMAVLEQWDIKLAIIDIMWGCFVYIVAALTGSLFNNKNIK